MNGIDITTLKRKQLIEHFEKERQEWLALGVSEADIFRIHFGEYDENGRGGDYRIWLDERRHTRSDHKYASGVPLSFDDSAFINDLYADRCDEIDNVDFSIDMERAFVTLTELQKKYVIQVFVNGFSYADLAKKDNISETAIRKHIKLALPKLKKYFE